MIRFFVQGDTFYIITNARLLEDQLEALSKAFDAAIEAKTRYLFLDCRDLEQICLPAQRLVVAALHLFETHHIQFGCFGLSQKMQTALTHSGLHSLLVISETEFALRHKLKRQTAAFTKPAANGK